MLARRVSHCPPPPCTLASPDMCGCGGICACHLLTSCRDCCVSYLHIQRGGKRESAREREGWREAGGGREVGGGDQERVDAN